MTVHKTGKKKLRGLGKLLDKNSNAYRWHSQPPRKIPAKQNMSLLIIIMTKLGANLSKDQAGAVPSTLKMKLNY